MKKNILIIGGGISGLSFLHFLKSLDPVADVCLLEREGTCGGTVRSLLCHDLVFEHGPNGILANQPRTLQLFSELGLDDRLIESSRSSLKRYILRNGRLNSVPSNPAGLIKSGYLSFFEMMRAAGEMFVRRHAGVRCSAPLENTETIHEFASRRFGPAVAEKLFDPLIKGIYGGNARRLHMRSAFPKIACLEDECGSVIRGMIRRKRRQKNSGAQRMLSFAGGMQTVTDALSAKYAENIHSGESVLSVRPVLSSGADPLKHKHFVVQTSQRTLEADHVVCAIPAYAAAGVLQDCDKDLADLLGRVEYAPMAVVGMIYDRGVWKDPVEGYGYLVASSERIPVLGVLFEDQVFQRAPDSGRMLLRVMIGGSDDPDIVRKKPEDLQRIARDHLAKVLGLASEPEQVMIKIWPRAIPQYTVEYARIKPLLTAKLDSRPNLHLLANYWGGVSFNDCVDNAYNLARRV